MPLLVPAILSNEVVKKVLICLFFHWFLMKNGLRAKKIILEGLRMILCFDQYLKYLPVIYVFVKCMASSVLFHLFVNDMQSVV